MNKISSYYQGIMPAALAALFIAVLLAIELPTEIYINNASEFTTSFLSVAITLMIGFTGIFLIFFLPALIPNNTVRARYFSFAATLGILMWFNAHFLYGNYGALDGRGLDIEQFSIKAIVEAAVWIILLILSIIYSLKIKKIQLQAILGLLILILAFTTFSILQYHWQSDSAPISDDAAKRDIFTEDFLTFSKSKNIIHIVLDEQQYNILQMLIEADPNFLDALDGFILFPNTAANFPNTIMAIPALLTAKVYNNQTAAAEFSREALSNSALLASLETANYSTSIYTLHDFCNYGVLQNCIPAPGLSSNMSAFLLVDYGLLRSAPDILKPKIYRKEEWFIARFFRNPNYRASLPGIGYLSFAALNQNFTVQDVPPTYKFYHTLLTHSPSVLDSECELLVRRVARLSLEGRLEQSKCAFKLINEFIYKLKAENIYDETMIIISSDHGGRSPVAEHQDYLKEINMESDQHTMALATLLIKPFNSHGKLKVSLVPTSLSDIPSTILASANLPLIPESENIFALNEQTPRVREFNYFSWRDVPIAAPERLPPFTTYYINGDVRDPRNWSIKCSDRNIENTKPCTPQ